MRLVNAGMWAETDQLQGLGSLPPTVQFPVCGLIYFQKWCPSPWSDMEAQAWHTQAKVTAEVGEVELLPPASRAGLPNTRLPDGAMITPGIVMTCVSPALCGCEPLMYR